jgi:hypothetical protein
LDDSDGDRESDVVRSPDDFHRPTPSDPLAETERFRDMREALRDAATPEGQVPRTQQRRRESGWRRVLRSLGLTHRR